MLFSQIRNCSRHIIYMCSFQLDRINYKKEFMVMGNICFLSNKIWIGIRHIHHHRACMHCKILQYLLYIHYILLDNKILAGIFCKSVMWCFWWIFNKVHNCQPNWDIWNHRLLVNFPSNTLYIFQNQQPALSINLFKKLLFFGYINF